MDKAKIWTWTKTTLGAFASEAVAGFRWPLPFLL